MASQTPISIEVLLYKSGRMAKDKKKPAELRLYSLGKFIVLSRGLHELIAMI